MTVVILHKMAFLHELEAWSRHEAAGRARRVEEHVEADESLQIRVPEWQ